MMDGTDVFVFPTSGIAYRMLHSVVIVAEVRLYLPSHNPEVSVHRVYVYFPVRPFSVAWSRCE